MPEVWEEKTMDERRKTRRLYIILIVIGIIAGIILGEITVYFLGYHPVAELLKMISG